MKQGQKKIQEWLLPIAVGIIMYGVLLIYMGVAIGHITDGRVHYTLDDAYIHMSVARNVAFHHVWGVSTTQFGAASSSPLWTSLLAVAFVLFGASELTPLIFNIIASIATLIIVDCALARFSVRWSIRLMAVIATVWFTSLPGLSWLGMEHSLHACISVALCVLGCEYAVRARSENAWRREIILIILSFIAVATRYESLALVGAIAIALVAGKRWRCAVAMCGAGALGVVLPGIMYLVAGGHFIPSSIIVKSASRYPWLVATNPLKRLYIILTTAMANVKELVLLQAAAIVALGCTYAIGKHSRLTLTLAWVVVVTSLAHFLFGSIGWMYRYEAYLFPLAIVLVSVVVEDVLRSKWMRTKMAFVAMAAILLLSGIGFGVLRGYRATKEGIAMAGDIFTVQYNMGLFLQQNRWLTSIMVGDIGASTWLSAPKTVTDVEGLSESTLPVSKLGLANLTEDDYVVLAQKRRVQVALLYKNEEFHTPSSWTAVGRFIPQIGGFFPGAIYVYVLHPSDIVHLRDTLKGYKTTAPGRLASHVEVLY